MLVFGYASKIFAPTEDSEDISSLLVKWQDKPYYLVDRCADFLAQMPCSLTPGCGVFIDSTSACYVMTNESLCLILGGIS